MGYKAALSSWYTKGYTQKIITLIVFVVLSIILAYVIERLCYSHVLDGVDAAVAQYVPSDKIPDVKRHIYNNTSSFGIKILWYIFVCIIAMLVLVKASTRLNFVRPVILDKAVRFSNAMERLGLLRESEQSFFLRSNKLPLYIAEQPLTLSEEENVMARPYVFAHNLLSSQEFIHSQSGQRRLCVKADELQAAIDALYTSLKLDTAPNDAETVKSLQKRIMELETERRATNGQLVDNEHKIKELEAKNKELANVGKGEELREGKKKKNEQELALYAMIFAPVYRKISEGNHDSKDFTRAAFEKFFANELQVSGKLHAQLKHVTKRENFNRLPSNVFDAIWNNLKDFDLVNAGGAAPSGSLERLERLFYPGSR